MESDMKSNNTIKPISFLKAHASEVVREISENHKTMIITQNGEAKVVVQDIKVYEETVESLELLKLLALSRKSLKEGKIKPAVKSFQDIRKRIQDDLS